MRTLAIAALGVAAIAAACGPSAAAPTWTFAPPSGPIDAQLAASIASPSPEAVPSASPSPSASPTTAAGAAATPDAVGAVAATAPAAASVRIANFAFGPETVTVRAGGSVTWTNADGDRHSVLLGGSESARLDQGATYSRSFSSPGTFAYACGLHSSMTGTVVVLAAGSSTTQPGAAPVAGTSEDPSVSPTASPTASPEDRDDDNDRDDDDRDDDDRDDDDGDHSGHGGGDHDDDGEDHSGPGGGGSGHG